MFSKQNTPAFFFKVILGVAAFITLVPLVTMLLWNQIMPAIFGLTTITFWQALGLLILSKILFSGFAKHSFAKSEGYCSPNSEYTQRFKEKMRVMAMECKRSEEKDNQD